MNMTKIAPTLMMLVATLGAVSNTAAQTPVALATRQAALQTLSDRLHERDRLDRQQVEAHARQAGIPVRREFADGRVLELQRLVPGQGPVFYLTCNVDAADTVSTDEVWPGGSLGLNLDGSGMTAAEWDGGAIFADHPDLAGRVNQVDGASVVSGHSTHVAGTLIGAGDWLAPDAKGMAYAAQLDAYDWNSDTAEMAAAAASGQLISNHSYGIAAGWLYIGDLPPDTWWWIGGEDPADIEDPNFGYYDAESQLWDQIAYDAPYYLPVKAAGNDRSDIGPAPGEEYWVIDQDGNFLFTSTLPRQPDCAPAGYDCLPTHSVAKNILTVGAVDDVPGGYSDLAGPAAVNMADFSSWGPTDDGRIKPDLVGNGVLLFSTWPDNPFYALAAGTSMSAPNVTGSLLLLQQHYENLHGPGNFMRGATLKALAIHTADETGDAPGPDYGFGWGLLNTRSAAEVITEDGGDHRIIEGSLANGATADQVINVIEADRVVTATVVWADPPGTPVAPSLDPPDLMLVNDLDLRILHGPATYQPWVLDPAAPAAAATTGDNFRDNVEQVEVSEAGAGSYTVRVSHKGTLSGGAPQDYSLIISVQPPPPTGSGFLIDEDFSGGLPAGWTIDTPQGVSWTINDPVPGDSRLDNQTGGSGRFAMVDNSYTSTLTSLRTPLMDLSDNDVAILRFRSYFQFDELESINVDTSTNGGANWSNVWQWQGFNPFPTQYVLDLSDDIAGRSNVMLRFRYNTYGGPQGNLWQIDDIELEVFGGAELPGPATNPVPADGATGLGLETDLAWTPDALADSHDVYFGTSSPLGGGDFQGNQATASFDPGPLANVTTYYWRIDEVNIDGATAGPTWSFTTEAASAPTMHLNGLTGSALPPVKGRWTAVVDVHVEDDTLNAEPGVTVEGTWSNGANGSATCVTDGSGVCTVQKGSLKGNVPSVTFTVTQLTKSGMVYEPGDNVGGDSVVISQEDVDKTPSAADDAYTTDVDVPVAGNVMDNDDPGDGPAAINGNSLPDHGGLTLNPDGAFTYTPDAAYEGGDSFTYSIADQDGDVSNIATVTITVSGAEPPPPPPPPPGELLVSATPYKVKGVQHVELTWENFAGPTVDIARDGELLAGASANDGFYVDNIGVKGGGQTYSYVVCETGTANCAGATATF